MSEPHMPIKLKNTDNSALILQSTDGKWKDSIRDNVHSPKRHKNHITDTCNAVWNIYGNQRCAVIKSASSYGSYAVGDRDVCEPSAMIERTTSYARHAVWYCDGGKAGTTRERSAPYARHAVGDDKIRNLRVFIAIKMMSIS